MDHGSSRDCTLRIWDVRQPNFTMLLAAHDFEILSCDWNKYDECLIASSSVGKSIKLMVEDALVWKYDHHTEFAVGIDMSVLVAGLLAGTGDELVYVWQQGTNPRAA
ncbi:hypothetical protein ACFE04_006550 [Oxalis oulophora]